MRGAGLVGVHARRRWRRGKHDDAHAPDLVNRDFNPTRPDQVWAADVTQFRTGEGWLYLAAVLDLWSRRVLGWSMGSDPIAVPGLSQLPQGELTPVPWVSISIARTSTRPRTSRPSTCPRALGVECLSRRAAGLG